MSPNDASNERTAANQSQANQPAAHDTEESQTKENQTSENLTEANGQQQGTASLKKEEQQIELPPVLRSSLCSRCTQSRIITSGKGSVFLLCQIGVSQATWPKYPPQPIQRCQKFEPSKK